MIDIIEKSLDVKGHKSTMDAVMFYIVTLMVMVGFSTVVLHVLGMAGVVSGVGGFFGGHELHTIIGTGLLLVISSLILSGRKLTSDLFSIILVCVGIYLAFKVSILLGLVPITVVTMLKK